MGKLLDAFRKKYQQIQEFSSLPEPDPLQDPQAVYEHSRKSNDYQYVGYQVRRRILNTLRALPREQQLEFYRRCRKENAPKAFSEEDFLKIMNKETFSDLDTGFVWDSGLFGQDTADTIAVLEEIIGPEASESLGDTIDKIVPPTDPSIPEDDKLRNTYGVVLRETRKNIAENDPEREKKLDILSRAEKVLRSPKPDVLAHVNGMDHHLQDKYQTVVDADLNHYIDTAYGGKYKNKIVKFDSYVLKAEKYAPEIASKKNSSVTEAELLELENQDPELSPELLQEITDITDVMEEIGEAGYRENPDVLRAAPNGSGQAFFSSEQGVKNYAFWPLVMKRREIHKALANEDYDAADKALKEYEKVKKLTDRMMETAKKNPSKLCPGNVNSTRLTGEENEIPFEYTEDFISHSKVNGMYELFALSKNIGKPIPEILKNPAKAMREAGKDYVRKFGLNSPKTTAKKLVFGQSLRDEGRFESTWNGCFSFTCLRAFEGMASMARTPEEREKLNGIGALAAGCGSYAVNNEKDLWMELSQISGDKVSRMYEHAALLPDEDLDLHAMAETFRDPDWKKKLKTADVIKKLKTEGKLKVSELVSRMKQTISEAEELQDDPDNLGSRISEFDAECFRGSSLQAFRKVLSMATKEECATEEYQKFIEEVEKLEVEDAPDLTDEDIVNAMDIVSDKLVFQDEKKHGWFISSTNSPEHDRMTNAQRMLSYKLKQLAGEDVSDLSPHARAVLTSMDLRDCVKNAREATFDYIVLKTENGRKTSFLHDVGQERLNAAKESLKSIDVLSDELGFSDPSQIQIETVRGSMLRHRSNEEWLENHYVEYAARIMYAMAVRYKNVSKKEEERLLEEKTWKKGAAKFVEDPAFVRMCQNEGPKKIADYIVSGKSKLTDAYAKARHEVMTEQGRGNEVKQPQDMSYKEKTEIWKNKPIGEDGPVQGL